MTNLPIQGVVPSSESYRFISLTQNKVAIVDADLFEWLSQWKWYAHRCGNNYYAWRRDKDSRKCIALHREIVTAKSGEIVDHRNRNGLDCRRSNLRITTQQMNSRNRSLSSRNTSGIIGVTFCNRMKRWKATITVNNRHIHLGYHAEKEDAVTARREGEIAHFGENPVTNNSPLPPSDFPQRPIRKNSTGHHYIFRSSNGYGYFVRIKGEYKGWFPNKRLAIKARGEALRKR